MRAITFIKVLTDGVVADDGQITSLAAIRVVPRSLNWIAKLDAHVRPAQAAADETVDVQVRPIADVLESVRPLLDDAVLAGHHVWRDHLLLERAWHEHGHRPAGLGHSLLDTSTLSCRLWMGGGAASPSLEAVCESLGIDAGSDGRAMDDATRSLQVARVLLSEGGALSTQIAALEGDEREIAAMVIERLTIGRDEYGPWRVRDGRDYATEALEEVLDAQQYSAAQLIRLRRRAAERPVKVSRVFVCHPYANDPEGNKASVRSICRNLARAGCVPIAPQLFLPQFIDEETERPRALRLCRELLMDSDEVRVCGALITSGMKGEIEYARALGIPVVFEEPVVEDNCAALVASSGEDAAQ